jgi:hypothetical protein
MHQPLHVGEHQDRGGNDVRVVFFGRPMNLHTVWDSGIFERMHGRGLDEPIDDATAAAWRSGAVDDWLWESQRLAREVVYGKLPSGSPAVSSEEYQAAAEPVVRSQMRKAAVRLAQVLNEIWPDPPLGRGQVTVPEEKAAPPGYHPVCTRISDPNPPR